MKNEPGTSRVTKDAHDIPDYAVDALVQNGLWEMVASGLNAFELG